MMNLPRRNNLRHTYKALIRQHARHKRTRRNKHRTRKYKGGRMGEGEPNFYIRTREAYNMAKKIATPIANKALDASRVLASSAINKSTYFKPFVNDISKQGKDWLDKNVISYTNKVGYAITHVPVFSLLRTLVVDNTTILPNLNLRDVALLSLISAKFIRAAFIPLDNSFESFAQGTTGPTPGKMNYHMYSTNSNMDLLIGIFGHDKIGKHMISNTTSKSNSTFIDSLRNLDFTKETNTRFTFTLIKSKVKLKEHHEGSQLQSAEAAIDIIDVGYLVYKVPFTNEDRAIHAILEKDLQSIIENCSKTPESYLYHSNEIFGFTENKNDHKLNLHPSMIDSKYGVKIHMRQGCKPLFKPGTGQYKNAVPIVYLNITENLIKSPLVNTLAQYDEKEFNSNGEYKETAAGVVKKYLDNVSTFLDSNINIIFHAANVIKHTPYDDYTAISPKIIFTNLLEPSQKVNIKFDNYVAIRVILSHFAQYLLCKGINVYISPKRFSEEKSPNVIKLIEYMIMLRKNTKTEVSGNVDAYTNKVSQYYTKVESFLAELTTILTKIAFKNDNNEVWKTVLASIFGLVVLNPYTQMMTDLNYALREQSIESSIETKQREVNNFLLLIKNVSESSGNTPYNKNNMYSVEPVNVDDITMQEAVYIGDDKNENYAEVGTLINQPSRLQLAQEIKNKGSMMTPI